MSINLKGIPEGNLLRVLSEIETELRNINGTLSNLNHVVNSIVSTTNEESDDE